MPFERLVPRTAHVVMDADPAADVEFNFWRAPVACEVVGVYICNDANIATATNTLLLAVGKSSAGTGTFATLASKAAATAATADTPQTLTLTTTTATKKLAAGDWLRIKYDETGTGTWSRMAIQVDYIGGYED